MIRSDKTADSSSVRADSADFSAKIADGRA